MSKKSLFAITVSVFVTVTLAACSLTGAPVVTSGPGQVPTVPLETLVAKALTSTAEVQAAIANAVAATQTAMATVLAATPTAMATATPQFTFTPSFTPAVAFTSTPSVPMVSVSVATNCRSGPTTAYGIIGILNKGQSAQVVGRSIYSDTLVIKLSANSNVTCWLWTQNATVSGDISGLPYINVPSTPTAVASFNVEYSSTITCSGKHVLKFKITNTGGITWESNRIKATDQVTNEEHSTSRDNFPNEISGCSLSSDAQNLEAGEVGYTMSGGFSGNPSGHSFKATITVCSEDGMDGTCSAETITFTP